MAMTDLLALNLQIFMHLPGDNEFIVLLIMIRVNTAQRDMTVYCLLDVTRLMKHTHLISLFVLNKHLPTTYIVHSCLQQYHLDLMCGINNDFMLNLDVYNRICMGFF